MTFAISKELQFLAGHRFHVKLTTMGIAMPLREIYMYQHFRKLVLLSGSLSSQIEVICRLNFVFVHVPLKL